MNYLVGVTLLWAFSFSLIGVYLAGQVDAYFSVLTRIVLASLVFLPFLTWHGLRPGFILRLMALGGTQLGLMYLFYYHSFLLLSVPEVLIFTIFTPLYVTALYDLMERRFNPRFLWGALLAVAGAAVIRFDGLTESYLLGFLVVQGANLCFALGQVGYKVMMEREATAPAQHQVFGWFYLGALTVALPAWWLLGEPRYPSTGLQWGILLWLGVGASGLGYFMWNKGATRVSSGVLAIMNNALIPAGLVVNLLLWNKETDLIRLLLGGAVMALSLRVCRPANRAPY
ncbi:carboxylate/amino acid/amine transporter [Aeromonas simiae]|uniref:carboxylate/amino acid/amine transporter n=1 Tax=Aeromonas simiae TaxID=218936 RepID=UPI00266C0D55|nr:carboxylate/amino acid/amine transporter [Aeromonas simiae]MDO2949547.1 carboxylate/amino acid/amine transporter [Aeromonas simiae]MDO2953211.1 carboxylate/amino acid/amine transporter [Aeromonas simiae]MDO2956852.1 carboxylate/amino acid/amine transporter [Aeromonas simiae]